MSTVEKVHLGSFEITSGKVHVSDPCYTDLGSGKTVKVKNGKYDCYVEYSNDYFDWERVRSIEISLESGNDYIYINELTVDSGQMGIFEAKSYLNDSIGEVTDEMEIGDTPFYKICCHTTLSEQQCGIVKNGLVSSSGYGDGSYPVYAKYNKDNEIVGIKVEFIEDEFDYDEYDDEDEWTNER